MRQSGRVICAWMIAAIGPTTGHALQVDLSNTSYYVSSSTWESANNDYVTGQTQDSGTQPSPTGDISTHVQTAYASATSELAGFDKFSARSAIDGMSVYQNGLASAGAEGDTIYHTDLVVRGEAQRALVEITAYYDQSSSSSDPIMPYDCCGTDAITSESQLSLSNRSTLALVAYDPLDSVGTHVLSGIVDVGVVYRLQAVLSAYSLAIRSGGSANVSVSLEILSISAQPIPEPATSALIGLGLVGLAIARRNHGCAW